MLVGVTCCYLLNIIMQIYCLKDEKNTYLG